MELTKEQKKELRREKFLRFSEGASIVIFLGGCLAMTFESMTIAAVGVIASFIGLCSSLFIAEKLY